MIVIALGGNALLSKDQKASFINELKNADTAMKLLSKIADKNSIVITHGNGPQIGNKLLQMETSKETYEIPLYAAVAETQGEIGYILTRSLSKYTKKKVVALVTHIIVDEDDPAFHNLTKPIGPFYNKKQYDRLKKKYILKKVHGGYRRVVASPKPLKIIESDLIEKLSNKSIVIACGGGGIPVYKHGKELRGAYAVIDKDLSSALLAKEIGANMLVILTNVNGVYINYGKKNQKLLRKIKTDELNKYIKQGHFGEGSMLPKVQAAINFVKSGKNRKAVITSLEKIDKGIKEKAGTIILN